MGEPWLVWAVIGVLCIGLEMLLPGFVIFFFGMGGIITALCCLIPFVADMIWLQVLFFVAFSTLSLVFLRSHFTKIFKGTIFDSRRNTPEDGIDEIAEVIEDVGPVKEGRIRFHGTSWKAYTREGEIPAGSQVRILVREGMTYIVGPATQSENEKGEL